MDFPLDTPIYVREEPKLCDREICELIPVRARFHAPDRILIRTVYVCPECSTYYISRSYYENLTEGLDHYTFIRPARDSGLEENTLPQKRSTNTSQAIAGWALTHPFQGGVCSGK